MTKKEYNGWTNYETWVVKLWMDNSAGVQDAWVEQASEVLATDFTPAYPSQTREDWAKYQLSEQIKAEHEENNPCCQFANCYTDLMNAALSEVNGTRLPSISLRQHNSDKLPDQLSRWACGVTPQVQRGCYVAPPERLKTNETLRGQNHL